METLQVTKYQARQAIYTYEFANDELKNKDLNYLERQAAAYDARWDNITQKDNNFIYVRNLDDIKYEFIIDVDKMCLQDKVKINDETFTIGYLKGFLADLTEDEQEKALTDMYIQPIEKYLEQRTGKVITLHKKLYKNRSNKWALNLFTTNLIEDTGICKAMLKELHIEINNIGYSIDNETGEQCLYFPAAYFYYTHNDDGHNGHEMGRIHFDSKTGQYQGYNYETQTWEDI